MNAPDEMIRLSPLSDPSDVSYKMAKMKTEYYCYCLAYQPKNVIDFEILKFGQSSPDPYRVSKSYGERIYRQIANLPGWPKPLPLSSHGTDLIRNIDKLKREGKLPMSLDRHDFIIGIWDIKFRNRMSGINIPTKNEVAWLEGELCSQYFLKNGRLPLLNVKDPRKSEAYKRSLVLIDEYQNNFYDHTENQLGLDNFNFQ